jgi:HK97 family phage portal protein
VTVIVSGGSLRPVGRKEFPIPTGYTPLTYGGTPGYIPLLRGDLVSSTYEGIYKSQPVVFAVVNKLVYGLARNRLVVQATLEDGSHATVPGTSLGSVLTNPYPRGSEFDIKSHLGLSAFIHGEAILLKYRPGPGQAPTELWPIPWRTVEYIADERGPLAYTITLGGVSSTVGPEDVVHVRLPGGSPLEPLRRTVALEDAAATWQNNSLKNGVTPRGAFTTDGRINDAVLPRLREELTKLYAGPDNAGRAAILEGGVKWQQIGLSAADAQLIDQRKFSREEVAAAYDVPLTLIVPQPASGFQTTIEARRSLFDAIAARIALIEDTVNAQLVTPEPEWASLRVKFDTNELLRPDPEARARMHMLSQQASTTTINERREIEGLIRIDDPVADTVFMPVNMVPVGVAPPTGVGDDTAGTPAQGLADRVITAAITGDDRDETERMTP